MKNALTIVFSLLLFNTFCQKQSIDAGIGAFNFEASYNSLDSLTDWCAAKDIIDVGEEISFIPDFADARCINLKKSKMKTLFNLQIKQGQIYFDSPPKADDLRVYTIKFYLALPKNMEAKAAFIEKIETHFGKAHHWVHPDSKEIIRMDWSTEKTFGCLQLGYDMKTDKNLEHYVFAISRQ